MYINGMWQAVVVLGEWRGMASVEMANKIHTEVKHNLTFKSLAVTLRATRFKIKKIRMLITLHLCVLRGSQN